MYRLKTKEEIENNPNVFIKIGGYSSWYYTKDENGMHDGPYLDIIKKYGGKEITVRTREEGRMFEMLINNIYIDHCWDMDKFITKE